MGVIEKEFGLEQNTSGQTLKSRGSSTGISSTTRSRLLVDMDVVVLVDVDYVGLEVHALEGRHEGSPDDLGPARDAGLPLAHGRRAAAVAAAVRRR